ncbi:arylsulfatase [Novipirellula artificiosorum]|uniref:Arylsulfatase n=1 Tax=Novipirellula artificiosorum TaxID=2528016 RepID=A0A5C6D4U6_9BACT|nr:arylsulfatase [Novipirellula artificiosorum]TWU31798.1 Arylsulfatase precursor [Novipirellula artificiosorum]
MTRSHWLPMMKLLVGCFVTCSLHGRICAERPNVIVIMSDDQGGGDYGFLGNDVIKTPQLDAMHARSGLLRNFYVSPVCAPTRASLMTGRYNYRTRCVDTWIGRAMMDSGEVTLAECLRDAGYRTGIYGKWHMGDNYPLRAMDQGFGESLVHRGGGIGQPSDPIGAEGKYTDPTLFRNGKEVQMKGYCTDLFFDAAMDFIDRTAKSGDNFFTYIATNAPHGPFDDVPMELYEVYKRADFSPILVNELHPNRRQAEFDKLARIAAMITNIDENVGRLFHKLDQLGIRENTIVIYLNDNGPNSLRYVGEMRGMKTGVDDGGIRSPLLFHWPAKVKADATSDALCAHIDVMPTILDACEIDVPRSLDFDGRSFLPLLTGRDRSWPTRQVVFQSHRGNVPQLYNHFAIHEDPWKLVHPSGFSNERFEGPLKLELYDLSNDPKQENDLAEKHPDVVERLRKGYETWFSDVSSTREDNYAPPRIIIGTEHERETVLTRQDWRHASGKPWASDSNGYWLLEASEPADYEIELIFASHEHPAAAATISANGVATEIDIAAGRQRGHRTTVSLPAGKIKLAAEVTFNGNTQGPHQIVLQRR